MSRRRCRTLCGLRSFTFARKRIGLCQAGEPEALPVKGLEQDKDETTLEACTPEKHRVHARQGSGSSHLFSISELWSCGAVSQYSTYRSSQKSAFRYNSTSCRTGKPTDPPTFVNTSAPLCALFQIHYPHQVPIRILTAFVVR